MTCHCEGLKMNIILEGNPVTKKNHMQIVGGRRLIQSEAYQAYEEACLWQIPAKARRMIEKPVSVRCVYYMATRRKVDLINLLAATHDILVKAGVLADDNCLIVCNVDGSRVDYDKARPRVEITITDLFP